MKKTHKGNIVVTAITMITATDAGLHVVICPRARKPNYLSLPQDL